MKFCTYLTIYRGNKLPCFYIGSTSIKNIDRGYFGSVESKMYKSIWKKEIKENRNLFSVKILSIHESRKEAYEKELFFHKSLHVVKNPLYCNLSDAVGSGKFGSGFTGRKHTEEHKKYISKKLTGIKRKKGIKRPAHSFRMLGDKNPMYGINREGLFKQLSFSCVVCKRQLSNYGRSISQNKGHSCFKLNIFSED